MPTHSAYSNKHEAQPELCRENIFPAVKQLVTREFGDRLKDFSIQPPVGVLCHESGPIGSDMADVLIRVALDSGELLYSNIHIHFSSLKKSLETTDKGAYSNWTPYTDEDEWQEEWCEFITYVYPEELSSQKCTRAHTPHKTL